MKTEQTNTAEEAGASLKQALQKATNCVFHIERPRDGLWGNCHSINNCTGMIGMVQRREVDFALGASLLCLEDVAVI